MFVEKKSISIFIQEYIEEAKSLLDRIEVHPPFAAAISHLVGVLGILDSSNQVILVGNGGSAAIASEVANRFWKFCGIRAMTFNDPATLTSTANDCGVEELFAKPLEVFGRERDVLIAISSSGASRNIIRAAQTARKKEFSLIVTLSGFKPDNILRSQGDLNFYIPSSSYRHVERTHLFILDCLVDVVTNRNPNRNQST